MNKKMLLLLLVVFSVKGYAVEATCSNICNISSIKENRTGAGLSSTGLSLCKSGAQFDGSWEKFLKEKIQNDPENWKGFYAQIYKDCKCEGEEKKEGAKVVVDQKTKDAENLKNAKLTFQKLLECNAIASLTSWLPANHDWSDFNELDNRKISNDGLIKCKGSGIQTQDFPACVNLVNAYDTATVVEGVTQAAQTIQHNNTMQNTQTSIMNNQNQMTAGLKGQEANLKSQANIAETQSGLNMAKMAALTKFYNDFPSYKDLVSHCTKTPSSHAQITEKFKDQLGKAIEWKNLCDQIANREQALIKITFLENQGAADAAKKLAIKAGVDSALFAYKGSLLNDQAGKVGDAIKAVDAFEPVDFSGGGQQEVMLEKCQADPMAAECQGDGSSYHGLTGQTLTIGGTGGTTTVGGNAILSEEDKKLAASGGVVNSPSDLVGIGGVDGGADRGPAGIIGAPGAAGVRNEQRGGGGGGGLSLGGGGGGGSGSGDGAPAGNSQNIIGSSVAYGDSRGILGYGGGGGLGGGQKKDSEGNPFESILGKNGEKIPKGGTMNFRDPASEKEMGDPSRSIFDRISDGYVRARTGDKLLKYESVK